MRPDDRIQRANARSRRVPALVLPALLAFVLAGVVLALLVPLLHSRGLALRGWMACAVIGGALLLALGRATFQWVRSRR